MTITETRAEPFTLVHLDVERLVDDGNIRFEPGDLHSLTASIRANGIIVPLTVAPMPDTDDTWRVIAGHRRFAVARAIELATVPCFVRTDLTPDGNDVVAMLDENLEREGLSSGEVAAAYQQLSLAGWSQTRIAKATRAKRDEVKAALSFANDETLVRNVHTGALTFDQAARMAALDLSDDDVDALVDVADSEWEFNHDIKRHERDVLLAQAKVVARGLGLTLIADVGDDEWPEAQPLRSLDGYRTNYSASEEEEAKREEAIVAHSECPGHAVEVMLSSDDEAHYVPWCLDPVQYGHVEPEPDYPDVDGDGDGDGVDEQEARINAWEAEVKKKEAASAERKLVIANNKAWRDAEPVRRDFLRELYARKTAPKGALRFAVELVPSMGYLLQHSDDNLLADLTGTTMHTGYGVSIGAEVVAAATDRSLPVALLAVVGTAIETTSDVAIWRNEHSTGFAMWLRYLATVGYVLSDVEQLVVDNLTKREQHAGKKK